MKVSQPVTVQKKRKPGWMKGTLIPGLAGEKH